MNIWSLQKQPTIKHLLLRLTEHFGEDAYHLAEAGETSPLSVRITPPDESMTIYIYCYGQDAGRYGVHFEFPTTADASLMQNEESYEDLSFSRLVDMLSLYL